MAHPLSRKDLKTLVKKFEQANQINGGDFRITANRPEKHQPAVIITIPTTPRERPISRRISHSRKRR